MTVVAPCDHLETKKAVLAAAQWEGPVYIRFGREAVPVITQEDTPFEFGKARVLREGTDVVLIACGAMVHETQKAALFLAEEGIESRVIDLHTIKPLDEGSSRSVCAIRTAK